MKSVHATFAIALLDVLALATPFPAARAGKATSSPQAAASPQGARQFLDYIKTPATAALLERYGFVLPGKNPNGGKH
jgi:hypothetical protein